MYLGSISLDEFLCIEMKAGDAGSLFFADWVVDSERDGKKSAEHTAAKE